MAKDIPGEYVPLFRGAGMLFGHSTLKLAALCWGESTFNPNAVSSAGARGLMQVMEGTWEHVGCGSFDNAFVPLESVIAGCRYLNECRAELAMVGRFGPEWEFAAYNCGWGKQGATGYKNWEEVPDKVRTWIGNIMQHWADYVKDYPGLI